MNAELVTQIIILATAIVGLYKAATFRPSKGEKNEEGADQNSELGRLLTPLLGFVGYFGFMLAFPAFIWVFTWITTNIPSSTSKSTEPVYEISFQVKEEPSNSELMFLAATNIPYSSEKNDSLVRVVKYALENNEPKIAVIAANSIPYSSEKKEQLVKIISFIEGQSKPNVMLNSDAQHERAH